MYVCGKSNVEFTSADGKSVDALSMMVDVSTLEQ